MIRDPFFSTALINSTIFTVTSIVFQNLIGLVAALAFAYAGVRGGKFIRPILFYPAILSPVIVGLLWTRILLSQGVLNQILRSVGLGFLQRDWLTDPSINIWVITGVSIWQWSGFNMTLYYAALKSIPQDFIDAGKIDGADDWNIIRRILIPLIKPTIIVAIVLNLIGGFKIFDLIYVMTCGGPFHASEVLSTYIYFNAFSDLGPADFGYGAAIGVILFIMILLPSILQMRWLYSQTIEY
jgi:ABC-type sugar transport system permease subunit